jgi:hypothetical protein
MPATAIEPESGDMIRTAFLVVLVCSALGAPAVAQQPVPRTPEGRPDFQGVWESNGLASTERLPGASGLVVDDDEAKKLSDAFWAKRFEGLYDPHENLGMARQLSRVNGQWRTSTLTEPPDGKMPLSEKARKLIAEENAQINSTTPDSYETRKWQERCLAGPGRPPMPQSVTDNLRQIVQTPTHLVMLTETDGAETRIIPINGAHGPDVIRTFLGDSTARWEGDELVIETINMRGEQFVRMGAIMTRTGSRIIERLSFISPDEVLYRFTAEDPEGAAIYTRPWSGEYSFNRSKQPIFEWECSAGNYSLPNILRAAREAERKAAAAKANPGSKAKP